MEGHQLYCQLCHRVFFVPHSFYERVHTQYHCDLCVEAAWVLQQPHILLLSTTSREELKKIESNLRTIPASCIHGEISVSNSTGHWSLDVWYDQILCELLLFLTSLRIHYYALINANEDEDSLIFWSDYQQPQGRLASFVKNIVAREHML